MKLLLKITLIATSFLFVNPLLAKTTENKESKRLEPGTLFPKPQQDKSKTTPPAKTELVEPAFMAKVTAPKVVLKWNSVEGAENYHIQVATDPNFKWLKLDNHFQKMTTYDLSDLESGKTYYWRVAAIKNSNDSMYIKGQYEKSVFTVK